MSFNSLSDLRKSRGNFETLMKEVEKINKPATESYEDDRIWKPTVDKAKNGYAVIRFLPPPQGESFPWVRIWNHGFQGPTGRWYIENSLTTLNQPDPVSELNSRLWNSGIEADKETARKQKRRLTYISNILVIQDKENPENEGKVFLFKYGKKIFDKIKDLMQPQFEDETPINPFDFWTGANFKLKIRDVEGYRNYDKSEFESPSPLSNDDEVIENIWKQQHSLQEFLDPKNFKTYAELKTKLDQVLSNAGGKATTAAAMMKEDEEAPRAIKTAAPTARPKNAVISEDDEDDDISYFASLAEED